MIDLNTFGFHVGMEKVLFGPRICQAPADYRRHHSSKEFFPSRSGAKCCRRQLRSALGPQAPRACLFFSSLFCKGAFEGYLARFGSFWAPFCFWGIPFWFRFWYRKQSPSALEFVKHLQTTADTARLKNSSLLGQVRNVAVGNLDPL